MTSSPETTPVVELADVQKSFGAVRALRSGSISVQAGSIHALVREDGDLETDSIEDSLAGMAATEVNARWQAEMGEFFDELAGVPPDQSFLVLDEVFHLEDQLATTPTATSHEK